MTLILLADFAIHVERCIVNVHNFMSFFAKLFIIYVVCHLCFDYAKPSVDNKHMLLDLIAV